MAIKFNPFTGNLDLIDTTAAAGSDTQVQYNDNGSLGASADLTWDDTGKELGVGGDINLDDGGTYSTTLQMVTATANRTISFPDATGTVALVAGSSGQVTYNNAGAQAGLTSASIGSTGEINISLAGAASTPPVSFTGSWFTGGTGTTTKPQLLIEPTGTTSTAWSTSGTGFGVNAPSGFAGNLLDLQVNGTSAFRAASNSGSAVLTFAASGAAFSGTSLDSSRGYGWYFGISVIKTNYVGLCLATGSLPVFVGASSTATNRDTGLVREQASLLALTDGATGPSYLKQAPVAVSALPSAATVGAGTRGFVNDATATTFASIVAGGGANTVPVYSDGTNWLIG